MLHLLFFRVIYNHFCNPSPDTKSNRTGIQLLGVVVANRLPPFNPDTAGAIEEGRFFSTFASIMTHKYKELYAAAAEVLGMILAQMHNGNHVRLLPSSVYNSNCILRLIVYGLRALYTTSYK